MRVGLLSLFTLDGNGESEAPRDLGEIHICEMTRSPDAARKSQLGHVTCGRWANKTRLSFWKHGHRQPTPSTDDKQTLRAPGSGERERGKGEGAGE